MILIKKKTPAAPKPAPTKAAPEAGKPTAPVAPAKPAAALKPTRTPPVEKPEPVAAKPVTGPAANTHPMSADLTKEATLKAWALWKKTEEAFKKK